MDIRRIVLSLAAGAAIFAGCAKDESAPAPAPENAATPAPAEGDLRMEVQFLPSTNVGASTIQERLHGSVHPELTARLRLFIDTHGRMPENFYEFSNRSMDSVPPVPSGMKFMIDPADKTVKAVRK